MADRQLESGLLDPACVHVTVLGKRKSGKSELAWLLFESWPYDRVLIDPNGDLKVGPTAEDIEGEIPASWPRWPSQLGIRQPERRTLRFVPNFVDPEAREDIDRVAGLAYSRPTAMLFVDECHVAAPAGRMAKHPHMDRNLRQARHGPLSMILVAPRPLTVDPLVVAQADLVYIFRLPNPNDRKRVAECIGYDPKDLDEAVMDLGPHEYLRYDAATDELLHFPALPKHLIVGHAAA